MDIKEVLTSYVEQLGHAFKHELSKHTQNWSDDVRVGDKVILNTCAGYLKTANDKHHIEENFRVELVALTANPRKLTIKGIVDYSIDNKNQTDHIEEVDFHLKEDDSRMEKEGIKMVWANNSGSMANSEIAKNVMSKMLEKMAALKTPMKD